MLVTKHAQLGYCSLKVPDACPVEETIATHGGTHNTNV